MFSVCARLKYLNPKPRAEVTKNIELDVAPKARELEFEFQIFGDRLANVCTMSRVSQEICTRLQGKQIVLKDLDKLEE